MKRPILLFLLPLFALCLLGSVSCVTKHPKPPKQKVGSLPHNRPAPWEGNPMGMPTSM